MSDGDPRVPGEMVSTVEASIGDTATAGARRIVIVRLASLALVFIGAIVLSRTLGPDGRGAHAFYVALTVLLAAVLGLSAPSGGYILATRHGVLTAELAANAIWLAAVGGILAAVLMVILQSAFGFLPERLASIPSWPFLIAIGVAGFMANTHQLQLAYGRRRSISGALLSFGPYTVAAIGYLFLPLAGGGLPAALWIFALAPYVVAFVAALARPSLSIITFGRPRIRLVRTTIRQGLRMYPGELATIVHQRADVLLLGILATSVSLGIYVVAYQSVEPILVLSTAGAATILALGHGDPEVEGGAVIARIIRETLLVGVLLALLAAVLSPLLVPLVYGPDFRDAVLPLLILLPGIVALACGRIAMSDLVRRNMLGQLAAMSVGVMVLNVGLNLALIPSLGAVGAAIASLVSYSTQAGLAIAMVTRAGDFPGRSLLPGRADVSDLIRAWSPRSLVHQLRRPPG